MFVTIITLFPEFFGSLLEHATVAKAQKEGKLKVDLLNLRNVGIGRHKQVDDRPYGGGVGMILRVDIISRAIHQAVKGQRKARVVLLTPQGKNFSQKVAKKLAKEKHLVLLCGHYEGVDERVRKIVDEEISVGDYILSSGEVAAMVVLETVTRLLPNVLDQQAVQRESLSQYTVDNKSYTLLEPPQYTRPRQFKGMKVPKTLLSGDHQKIKEWRLREAFKKTKRRRPDLFEG